MYGNPAFDCDGAQIRALCRQLATVVTVNGDVDDTNLDHISHVRQALRPDGEAFRAGSERSEFRYSGHAFRCCTTSTRTAAHAGVEWSFIASQPVTRTVRSCSTTG